MIAYKWKSLMNNEDNDFNPEDDFDEIPVYIVDDATTSLLEVALNSIMSMSDMQVDDASALALAAIADELGDRFGINRLEVIETRHTDDNGDEEIIYSPRGGIMPDESNEDEDE
jgi:hypothetical protein|tara:strand:+ start:330 stop:671 length:342 start_codon:yes stop_codon:yes gene_type:complete